LMLAGALALAALPLGGCMTRRERRIMLAEDLLREKYGRDFSVVFEAYGFDTAIKPTAYCCAVGEEDLVFRLEFDAIEGSIVRDTYIGRKLGRQVEVIISDCFSGQGIEMIPHVLVNTQSLGIGIEDSIDPETSLPDYIYEFGIIKIHASIVITDALDSPRESPLFERAIRDFYETVEPSSRLQVFIVMHDNLEEYREYLARIPEFYGGIGSVEHRPIDGFLVSVVDSELEIIEDNFWM